MVCKKICTQFSAKKLLVEVGMLMGKKDVKYVKFLSNGKEYGVLVVDIC